MQFMPDGVYIKPGPFGDAAKMRLSPTFLTTPGAANRRHYPVNLSEVNIIEEEPSSGLPFATITTLTNVKSLLKTKVSPKSTIGRIAASVCQQFALPSAYRMLS